MGEAGALIRSSRGAGAMVVAQKGLQFIPPKSEQPCVTCYFPKPAKLRVYGWPHQMASSRYAETLGSFFPIRKAV